MKRDPSTTGIVHLWNLPQKIYLDLEKSYKFEMLKTARELVGGTWTNLAKRLSLGLGHDYIRSMRRKQSTSLWFLKKLSEFLVLNNYKQFSLKNIEKKITLIKVKTGKPIKNPKFPINFKTKEGAIIISAMLHDGGIDRIYNEPYYCNLNSNMKNRVINAIKEVVGDAHFTESYKQVQFPKILGIIFQAVGLKAGEKTLNNPKIPKFLLNASEEITAEYVAQAIADDGNVQYNGRGYIGIVSTVDLTKLSKELREEIKEKHLTEYAPNILKGDKEMLEKLGIHVYGPYFQAEKIWEDKIGRERHPFRWRIQVGEWRAIKLLSKKIKIPIDYKQENLIKLSSVERKHNRTIETLKAIKDLQDEGIETTLKKIVKRRQRNYDGIAKFLQKLCGKCLLNKAPSKTDKRCFVYFFTDAGLRELEILS